MQCSLSHNFTVYCFCHCLDFPTLVVPHPITYPPQNYCLMQMKSLTCLVHRCNWSDADIATTIAIYCRCITHHASAPAVQRHPGRLVLWLLIPPTLVVCVNTMQVYPLCINTLDLFLMSGPILEAELQARGGT